MLTNILINHSLKDKEWFKQRHVSEAHYYKNILEQSYYFMYSTFSYDQQINAQINQTENQFIVPNA